MRGFDRHDGRFPSAGGTVAGVVIVLAVLSFSLPATGAQAAWTAFVAGAMAAAWIAGRGSIERIEVERSHRPRVFEGEPVSVTMRLVQRAGLAQTLVVVEDQFLASLSIRQRNLVPILGPRWEARLHYQKPAERHRGLYLIGPVRIWAADPLGMFARLAMVDRMTAVTVYPRPVPLPGFRLLGPDPPSGPTLEKLARLGQAEEILGVRPYRPGDPPSRVHWRSSARRGALHVVELDTSVRSEVSLYLDLTRRSRFGTGVESTSEVAIGCATSILAEASAARMSVGMTWAREATHSFPAGAGVAHVQMLLDRLAVIQPEGEQFFWRDVAPLAGALPPGSRAIFLAVAASTPLEASCALVRGLLRRGVAADVVLLDESGLVRIYRDQEPTRMGADASFNLLWRALELSGARVFPMRKGQGPERLATPTERDGGFARR